MYKCLFLLIFLCLSLAHAQSPDYAREKRLADEIVPALVVGDAVYLKQTNGHAFLALHTPSPQARAGVIVVHGMGVHPDWNLIGTLRANLADQGYTTLAIQMPVLAADMKGESYPALFDDAADRLQAAVKFLRDRKLSKIAIVSHSMGARMANHYLADHAGNIDAWASIGISTGEFLHTQRFKAPVLDIYGEKDFPVVLQNASKRAEAIKPVRGSGQVQVAGADHYFNGAEAELSRHVRLFFDRVLR